MSLDKKLREIDFYCIIRSQSDLDNSRITEMRIALNDKVIAQIKQAFADDGYVNSKLAHHQIRTLNDKGYMTGQEWYSRFEEALDDEFHFLTKPVNIDSSVYYDAPNVMKAAQKASGMEGCK